MTKDEALEMLVAEKSAPALSRAFIAWLYKNGYEIREVPRCIRLECIDFDEFYKKDKWEKGPSEVGYLKSDILHNLSIKDTQS